MIKKITIENEATFESKVEVEFNKINYIYGGNGTGKTTISRMLNSDFKDNLKCIIDKENDDEIIKVYNSDFVEKNFKDDLRGIFTLGEKDVNLDEEIKSLKEKEIINTTNKKENKENIDTLNKEKQDKFNTVKDIIWNNKNKLKEYETIIFKDFNRGKSKEFFIQINDRYKQFIKNPTNNIKELSTLKEQYNRLYKQDLFKYNEIIKLKNIEYSNLNKILKEPIVSTSNSQMKFLIEKLNNLDWVKQGEIFLDKSDNHCPFCQQTVTENIKKEIINMFDETYKNKVLELEKESNQYKDSVNNIIEQCDSIKNQSINIIKFDDLENQIRLLKEINNSNIQLINNKLKETSTTFNMKDINEIINEINLLINNYNEEIIKNNNLYKNIDTEKRMLTNDFVNYFINEDITYLENYNFDYDKIENNLKRLSDENIKLLDEEQKLKDKLKEKQKNITSIDPTIDNINEMLNKINFTNFKLKKHKDNDNIEKYQIIRSNGVLVKDTLSEGEKKFLTFLYFYYSIYGSFDENATYNGKNTTIVIDDPICSLDSNIVYIVGQLIRKIIIECKNNKIGQIIVLTHNMYFYKEITEKGFLKYHKLVNQLKYFVVSKINNVSTINESIENPYCSIYDSLWSIIKNAKNDKTNIDKVSLMNAMRRIIETFFNFIEHSSFYEINNKIDNENDRIIAKSLYQYTNAESHIAIESIDFSITDENIDNCLVVFEKIFKLNGYEEHYNTMMQ